MKIVSIEEMRTIERQAFTRGMAYSTMMEKAGTALADLVLTYENELRDKTVLGLVGVGNNGGDTLIALSRLSRLGWKTAAYLVLPRNEEDELLIEYMNTGGTVFRQQDEMGWAFLDKWLQMSCVLLDGILGIGAHLPLDTRIEDVLCHIRSSDRHPLIISVDCPSGVDCDSGQAAHCCLHADVTACMEAVKLGLLKFPAFDYIGEIKVLEIGLYDEGANEPEITRLMANPEVIRKKIPTRSRDSHKGSFGKTLVIAGSINYTGAVFLAAKAAYRIGAGLVQVACLREVYRALAGKLPEAVWLPLEGKDGGIHENDITSFSKICETPASILMGPGWGNSPHTGEFLWAFIEEFLPMNKGNKHPQIILDADALRYLSKMDAWWQKLPKDCILTPHPGEMAALTGLSIEDIQNDRFNIAQRYSERWGQIVVLKGAITCIASTDGSLCVIPVATSSLAKAGTGDVLGGIISGLCAQGMKAFDAATAGAWLHAHAGLASEKRIGHCASVMASDVIDDLPRALQQLNQ